MPATLDSVTSSRCPPEPTWRRRSRLIGGYQCAFGSVAGIGDESLIDRVADVPLQRAHRFFAGLALGLFAEVVRATRCVMTDLGDSGHVDRVVQLSVTAWAQPVPFRRPGRRLDRCRAVVSGEVTRRREPPDITDAADDDRCCQRTDSMNVGR